MKNSPMGLALGTLALASACVVAERSDPADWPGMASMQSVPGAGHLPECGAENNPKAGPDSRPCGRDARMRMAAAQSSTCRTKRQSAASARSPSTVGAGDLRRVQKGNRLSCENIVVHPVTARQGESAGKTFALSHRRPWTGPRLPARADKGCEPNGEPGQTSSSPAMASHGENAAEQEAFSRTGAIPKRPMIGHWQAKCVVPPGSIAGKTCKITCANRPLRAAEGAAHALDAELNAVRDQRAGALGTPGKLCAGTGYSISCSGRQRRPVARAARAEPVRSRGQLGPRPVAGPKPHLHARSAYADWISATLEFAGKLLGRQPETRLNGAWPNPAYYRSSKGQKIMQRFGLRAYKFLSSSSLAGCALSFCCSPKPCRGKQVPAAVDSVPRDCRHRLPGSRYRAAALSRSAAHHYDQRHLGLTAPIASRRARVAAVGRAVQYVPDPTATSSGSGRLNLVNRPWRPAPAWRPDRSSGQPDVVLRLSVGRPYSPSNDIALSSHRRAGGRRHA